MVLNEKLYPTKFKSFQGKSVQMRALQKLQNSKQILINLWPVYPNPYKCSILGDIWELPLCNFPPPNTSIRGEDSQI